MVKSAGPSGRAGQGGHSLVELIVALVVLGVALSGMAATATLALRLSHDSMRLEDDAARSAFILDSLAGHGAPSSGASSVGRTRYRWTVTPSSEGWARLVVSAVDRITGATVVELTGASAPSPPRAADP